MKVNIKYNFIWLVLIAVLFALLSVLQTVGVLNLFLEQLLVLISINIILAVGLNLVIGVAGQFSLGHAGFMAIGAYTAAIVTLKSPTYLAFIAALFLAVLISGLLALAVGIPTLRLKGDYLAIATLGVAEIIRIFIVNFEGVTNGPAGLFSIPLYVNWQVAFVFVAL
jgi:branched-chain amino acid transport system permease protein